MDEELSNPAFIEHRRWDDLDIDCLVNIFGRVGIESLLLEVPFVCKSWHKASLNPSCWQLLTFPELTNDYYGYSDDDDEESAFIQRFVHEYRLYENRFSFTAFIKFVVDRSEGKATCLWIPSCASDDVLEYVADKCPALKSLRLHLEEFAFGGSQESILIEELIGNWKHLEEFALGNSYRLENFLRQISIHCKNFRYLCVGENADIGKDEAAAIVNLVPDLKQLILRKANIDRDDLVTLLRGCKELVSLDVRECTGFDEGDEEISKLAAHIPDFSCEGSTLDDYDDDRDFECTVADSVGYDENYWS